MLLFIFTLEYLYYIHYLYIYIDIFKILYCISNMKKKSWNEQSKNGIIRNLIDIGRNG